MANRFNALYLSGKHLDERGSFHFAWAIIRSADHGINAAEWERGVRILSHDHPSKSDLKSLLQNKYYEVLEQDAWSEVIDSLDEDGNVPNNNFKSSRVVYDKWDVRQEPC